MAISESKKFLKSTKDGYVYPYTEILAQRDDMIVCEGSGEVKAPKSEGQEAVGLEEEINKLRKRQDVLDIAARYDVEFDAPDAKIIELKAALIADLKERKIIAPESTEDDGKDAGEE